MTVRYIGSLANYTYYGCFVKLLFRWKGSVYKLIWTEYLAFISSYYAISFFYRFCLDEEYQRFFEKVCRYCNTKDGTMPMSFVLGFFVTTIVQNWWRLYQLVPWPDSMAHFLYASIRGNDEKSKMLRRNILRYTHLNLALTLRSISPAYRKHYPELRDFVKQGLLLEKERVLLEKVDTQTTFGSQWLPITWATDLIIDCKNEGRISEELNTFRKSCSTLLDYEICSVPLVYTQVVTISLHTYFLLALLGKQWLIMDDNPDNLNLYFPIFSTLQFIFFMGWFKVAEALINPFGNDDDDLELDEIMRRHMEISQLMVDNPNPEEDSDNCNKTEDPVSDVKLFISKCEENVEDKTYPGVLSFLGLVPPSLHNGKGAGEINHCVNIEESSFSDNLSPERPSSPVGSLSSYCGSDAGNAGP